MAKLRVAASIKFLRESDDEVSKKSGYILDCTTKNIDLFPSLSPKPTDPEVIDLIAKFGKSIKAAEDGSKYAIAVRNSYSDKVKTLMRTWAPQVTQDSHGDLVILVASGFDNVKQPEPTHITNTGSPILSDGKVSGSVVARVPAVKGAKTYQFRYTEVDPMIATPGDYVYLPPSSSRVEVKGKTPGKTLYFSARVAGTHDVSGWSETSSIIVR